MTTFSQLVDDLAARLAVPHLQLRLIAYLNQTVKELHSNARGKPVMFAKNLIEDQLTATLEESVIWTPPRLLQVFRTARYDLVINRDGEPVYPKPIKPGRALQGQIHFYYRSGSDFIFAGQGGIGATVSIAYYTHLPRLIYYPVGERPATFDDINGFTYFNTTSSGGKDYTLAENQQEAEDLTSHWMLLDWEEVLGEGVTHKIYKGKKDEERARTHFSQFQNGRTQLTDTEDCETQGA